MGSCLSLDGHSGSSSPSPPSSPASGAQSGSREKRSSPIREEQLHRIPGRMFLNGASGVASLFTRQGNKGTNQDAVIVWENFGSRNDTVFCGVFDGHGPDGHLVSKRVRDVLPLKLTNIWEGEECRETSVTNSGGFATEAGSAVSLKEEFRASADFEEKDKHSQIFRSLKHSLLEAFKIMDDELKQNIDFNCLSSGTTAVAMVKKGQEIVIGNVGDSRAVLGTRDRDNSLIAVQLTVDLKPNLPREAERIRRCKGRVFALKDEPAVARVWLPYSDAPGLAMARSLGDFCLKEFGLISIPEISYRHVTEKDEFVVLATDGVWDVLSNKEVVDIIASAPARSSAVSLLVESAVKGWRLNFPTSRIDDCTAVCLFLNADPSHTSSNLTTNEVGESLNATRASSSGTGILQDEIEEAPQQQFSVSQSHERPSDNDTPMEVDD